MSRIHSVFSRCRREGRSAFIPYIMAGDPHLDATGELVHELGGAGADLIEIGVPFSDPIADGPTIQRASERSLQRGTTLSRILSLVAAIRGGTETPLLLMSYYNPILKYGEERFVREAILSGVDGVIIPDLPPDEARSLRALCRTSGLDMIFLLAPTSTPERIQKVVSASTGFIYYVSLTGITGARFTGIEEIGKKILEIRSYTTKPIAVGFGVSRPEEAASLGQIADGVIVGSALVRLIEENRENYLQAARDFTLQFHESLIRKKGTIASLSR